MGWPDLQRPSIVPGPHCQTGSFFPPTSVPCFRQKDSVACCMLQGRCLPLTHRLLTLPSPSFLFLFFCPRVLCRCFRLAGPRLRRPRSLYRGLFSTGSPPGATRTLPEAVLIGAFAWLSPPSWLAQYFVIAPFPCTMASIRRGMDRMAFCILSTMFLFIHATALVTRVL